MTDTSREAINGAWMAEDESRLRTIALSLRAECDRLAAERDASVAVNQAAANYWIEHQAHLCDLLCAIHGGHSYTAHHGLERSMVEAKTIVEKAIAAKEAAERACKGYSETLADVMRIAGNLLAVIHRDGGHYQDEHGFDKAAADAGDAFLKTLHERDEAMADKRRYAYIKSRLATSGTVSFAADAAKNLTGWRIDLTNVCGYGATPDFDVALDAAIAKDALRATGDGA